MIILFYRPDTTRSYLYELRMLWSAHYPALDLTHGIHFVRFSTLSVLTKWSKTYFIPMIMSNDMEMKRTSAAIYSFSKARLLQCIMIFRLSHISRTINTHANGIKSTLTLWSRQEELGWVTGQYRRYSICDSLDLI